MLSGLRMASDLNKKAGCPTRGYPATPGSSWGVLRGSPRRPAGASTAVSDASIHRYVCDASVGRTGDTNRVKRSDPQKEIATAVSPRRSRNLTSQRERTQPPWTSITNYLSHSSVYMPGARKCWSPSAAVGSSARFPTELGIDGL
jgi:hypothetical protein